MFITNSCSPGIRVHQYNTRSQGFLISDVDKVKKTSDETQTFHSKLQKTLNLYTMSRWHAVVIVSTQKENDWTFNGFNVLFFYNTTERSFNGNEMHFEVWVFLYAYLLITGEKKMHVPFLLFNFWEFSLRNFSYHS